MPVAAVAEIVEDSVALINAEAKEAVAPVNVCLAVNELAAVVTGILAPAKVEAPVPPEATANVADNPAAVPVVFWFKVGKVQLVNVPEAGMPNAGVDSVGDVRVLLVKVSVPVRVTKLSSDKAVLN